MASANLPSGRNRPLALERLHAGGSFSSQNRVANCAISSRLATEAEFHGKIAPEAGRANHQKTNSYTPAPSER
jgi:hypothetical protein